MARVTVQEVMTLGSKDWSAILNAAQAHLTPSQAQASELPDNEILQNDSDSSDGEDMDEGDRRSKSTGLTTPV